MTFADRFPRASAERVTRYRAAGLWDDRRLADGVEAAARRRPEAVALVDGTSQLSYAELAAAVAAAVTTMTGQGLHPGDGVVLVSGNTCEGVIAYHALLRLGATVVVLDRRCGAADVRAAVEAVAVRGGADEGRYGARRGGVRVVVPASEADRLREATETTSPTTVVPLELFGPVGAVGAAAGPAAEAPTAPLVEPDRDRASVLLFSSGTTSRPKRVVHSLNTLTAGARNMAMITSADERTVCYLVSPLTSITGLMQVHLAADQHATLVLDDRFDPVQSLRRMNDTGATLLGGAPVIAERLLRAATAAPGTDVSLRTLALGGAMLPRPLLELATDRFGIEIARVYGSSEAPNFSGSLASDEREQRLSDDGALMPGSEVRLGSPGHPQEGMLRGPSLFLGYLPPPEGSDDPPNDSIAFTDGPADGWYRSGDQVELHDGRLTVVGRLKEVVNRNGLKISLTEIDGSLAGLPGVLECASFAVPDPATGERLAVAVHLVEGARLSLDDVLAHLLAQGTARRKLPEQLVHWDEPLPRTASGKVVRSRLVMESPAKPADLALRLRPSGASAAASDS